MYTKDQSRNDRTEQSRAMKVKWEQNQKAMNSGNKHGTAVNKLKLVRTLNRTNERHD